MTDNLDPAALHNNPEGDEESGPGARDGTGAPANTQDQKPGDAKKGQGTQPKSFEHDEPPIGPWGNRGVTSRKAGTKKPPEASSSLNVRVNLDLRADVALELHAVIQGDITIGLF
ncbi:hypothetical protein BDV12DRAFT_180246 [Aspergillus spectabilis]